MKYAGFWRRFVAKLIDFVLLALPTSVMGAMGSFVYLLLAFLYFPFFESSEARGTLGKMAMGIEVVDEKGDSLSFRRALVRWLMSYVSGFLLGIGYLMNLFTPRRQTLHDLVAGALVIHRKGSLPDDLMGSWLKQFQSVFSVNNTVSPRPNSSVEERSATYRDLEKLHELYRRGALTEEEYQQQKKELLKARD
ncbi:MAG: RDD family protein [Bdellovibrionaceae bacterium]|nr:RDD family protein [Pseudobdellovibrionaceae bacterium]